MMEKLGSVAPHPQLAPFVRCFVHRETFPGSSAIIQPVIASLEQILGFDFCDRAVMHFSSGKTIYNPRVCMFGAQKKYPGSVCLSGHVVEFGIFFRPFASLQLFGIPPAELADLNCDATEVLGSWAGELWNKLAGCLTFSERVKVATESLLMFAKAARPLTAIMSTTHRLLPSDEPTRIDRIAHASAMSIRSYERQFAVEIGMSPKEFARLARFAKAIDLKRMSENSWLNISHEVGYFDQMHMVKDFRIFGGDAPGRLVQANSDFQPWSIRPRQGVSASGTAVARWL
jgi:AraC-like DNA-binding protein